MKYPKWIDEFAKGASSLFAGQVLEGFQPIDFCHFFLLWYDLFIARLAKAIRCFEAQKKTINEAVRFLPPPSNIRALMTKIAPSQHMPHKNIQEAKYVLEFLVKILQAQCRKDIFAIQSNIIHGPEELKREIGKVKWVKANKIAGHELGRLMLGLGHLVNGLYNDVVTDMAWDVYGPYDVSSKFGPGAVLLVRDYPNMKPLEIWPHIKSYPYAKVRIWTVYRGVNCRIRYVGCHTVTKGRPLPEAMVAYGFQVDGKWYKKLEDVKKFAEYFLNLSIEQAKRVKRMPLQARKEKALLQECYQLHRFMEWLGLDWRPTSEMRARIKKPIPKGVYPMGKLMTFSEFEKHFGINYLKRVYSKS